MRIAVTGASGLVGSRLVPRLRGHGHDVVTLVRREPRRSDEVRWEPARGELDAADLAGVEAAVHLAGAGIGAKRWTGEYKQVVLSSRVDSTTLLATRLAALDPRPQVLLSGSAIGFYGDAGDRECDESSPAGTGFLADVCRAWEGATAPAEQAGIRTVHLRTGLVLSGDGGMLAQQLPLYRLGLGGPLGSGRQWWSWVALADEVAAIEHLLTADVAGPVNITGPAPVRQRDFAAALGRALHRPAVLPVPRVALRAAIGEFADEGILAGQKVLPRVLEQDGYAFVHTTLDTALAAALG
ncbi:MAG TPA: TIGR01777 family oxidoreductase [Mycobacteriales bacterium]